MQLEGNFDVEAWYESNTQTRVSRRLSFLLALLEGGGDEEETDQYVPSKPGGGCPKFNVAYKLALSRRVGYSFRRSLRDYGYQYQVLA